MNYDIKRSIKFQNNLNVTLEPFARIYHKIKQKSVTFIKFLLNVNHHQQ